jgi:hypothetical protein
MLKTISNEWRRARGQFVRAGALGTVILGLAAAPPAEAEIIKLICDARIVMCGGAPHACGEGENVILTIDTARNLANSLLTDAGWNAVLVGWESTNY